METSQGGYTEEGMGHTQRTTPDKQPTATHLNSAKHQSSGRDTETVRGAWGARGPRSIRWHGSPQAAKRPRHDPTM